MIPPLASLLLAMPHSALALGLLLALSAGGVGWRWLAPILIAGACTISLSQR